MNLKSGNDDQLFQINSHLQQTMKNSHTLVYKEAKRMGFDSSTNWRISEINKDFKLCPSYPRYLVVPSNISDKELEQVASFRYSRRIPTAVWRYAKNGCIIARSSQPEVGWLGWRNNHDENLLQSLVKSCFDTVEVPEGKKLLIIDARSYAAAVGMLNISLFLFFKY